MRGADHRDIADLHAKAAGANHHLVIMTAHFQQRRGAAGEVPAKDGGGKIRLRVSYGGAIVPVGATCQLHSFYSQLHSFYS